MNKFQEMVRARLRDRTPNYTTLATFLDSHPSTVQKQFKEGGTSLCLDWLDRVSAFYQMSVAEMVSLPTSLWQAVSPLETQLLGHFRAMTELERHGLLTVLDRPGTATDKRRRPRMGHPELTAEQQLLVDLYQRSGADQRQGVLKILQGAAKQREADRAASRDTTE